MPNSNQITDPDVIYKLSTESLTVTWDFDHKLCDDETITSVSSIAVSPSGLTTSTAGQVEIATDERSVSARISGGTNSTTYTVVIYVATSNTNTLGLNRVITVQAS